jgi:hypothetical protein
MPRWLFEKGTGADALMPCVRLGGRTLYTTKYFAPG